MVFMFQVKYFWFCFVCVVFMLTFSVWCSGLVFPLFPSVGHTGVLTLVDYGPSLSCLVFSVWRLMFVNCLGLMLAKINLTVPKLL